MLVGKRVPQVPRRQGAAQLRYDDPLGAMLGIQTRFSTAQFDDDLNSLSLRGYWTADAFFGHSLNESVSFFVAAENLGNVAYDVGRTPVRTVGPPRTIRGGFRVRMSGHGRP